MKTKILIVVAAIALTLPAFNFPASQKATYEELVYVGGFNSLDGNEPAFVEVYADKRDSSNALYGSYRRYSGEKKLFIASGRCFYSGNSRSVAGFVMVADVTHGYSGPLLYP